MALTVQLQMHIVITLALCAFDAAAFNCADSTCTLCNVHTTMMSYNVSVVVPWQFKLSTTQPRVKPTDARLIGSE